MKYFAAVLGLLIWFVFTLLLIISIVGLVIVEDKQYLDIPHKLTEVFEN